jgi:hypothetical protein
MAYTPTTIAGKRLVEKLEPWITDDLARYADSIGQMFQSVLSVAEEEGNEGEAGWTPAWGKLLDPNQCPGSDLGYLGQFTGTEIPKTFTEAEARALVLERPNIYRGTRAHIEAEIKAVLGTTPFTIRERTNPKGEEAAYYFLVLVPKGASSAALTTTIEENKPGGVLFSVVETGASWIAAGLKWSEAKAGLKWSTPPEVGEY